MKKLTIIGYGNMAKAIACALKSTFALEIIGRDNDKITRFIADNALDSATIGKISNLRINVADKIIILCIKPHALESFHYYGKAHSVLSVMAGVEIARIRQVLDAGAYCRVMPNIASLVGAGISAIYAENPAIKNLANEIFSPLGECVFLDKESLINAAGAISGSGGAYLGVLAESLIDAGIREGLSLADSTTLANGLFKGFAKLLESQNPRDIKLATTSPGGTTAEALRVMESAGIRGIMLDAVRAAVEKSQKLS